MSKRIATSGDEIGAQHQSVHTHAYGVLSGNMFEKPVYFVHDRGRRLAQTALKITEKETLLAGELSRRVNARVFNPKYFIPLSRTQLL